MDSSGTLEILERIRANIKRVMAGKDAVIDHVLICLVCGGHALIEDVPGLGKTTLIAALAASVDCSFQRIQFTPDLLPSDVTGYSVYDLATGARTFQPGAVMNQIVLADEINRTSPKTQSALLQAMQEGQVTVDGVTHTLPRPFFVFATQNPVEMTGTYPLPEAQLDRFLLRIAMGYPSQGDEVEILERNRARTKPATLSPVASAGDVVRLQEALSEVKCSRAVMRYIVGIGQGTREHKEVALGVSPRGSIGLMRASMGCALLQGRDYVLPDDVQTMLPAALAHRILLRNQAYVQEQSAEGVLREVLRKVPVPAVT